MIAIRLLDELPDRAGLAGDDGVNSLLRRSGQSCSHLFLLLCYSCFYSSLTARNLSLDCGSRCALQWHNESGIRFTHDDETFLSGVARQGSIAIENARAYEALGKLDQMKSRFVLTVTHELCSPISVVRSLMRTLSRGYAGTLAEPQRDLVERAQHRADFLQTLVDDLLDLAAGKSELGMTQQREEINLGEAAEQVVKRFSVSAQGKHIALEWRCDCGDQPIRISAVSGEIDRLLNNLISNAIKYTPMGGRVSVTLRRAGDGARLEVSDTGIGIPEDARPHLFEEFYRAPNAKAQEKEGTGLGLAITNDLVTRYGGRSAVQSQVGQGSTFTVIFPLMRQ